MRTLYIDESKARGFLLAACEIPDSASAELRKTLNRLRMNGQSRLHMAKENDRRRRLILSELNRFEMIRTHLWEVCDADDKLARAACLRAAAILCVTSQVNRIRIERDDSLVSSDRLTLDDALRGTTVTYDHLHARVEPLLSVPDAVAWSARRGGEWADRCAGLICCHTRLSP